MGERDSAGELEMGTDDLIGRAMAGDQAAFTMLVTEHTPAMARVAYCVTNDLERSREAAPSGSATR